MVTNSRTLLASLALLVVAHHGLFAQPPEIDAPAIDQQAVAALLRSDAPADLSQAAGLIAAVRPEAVDLLPLIHRASRFSLLRVEFPLVLKHASGRQTIELFNALDESGKLAVLGSIRERVQAGVGENPPPADWRIHRNDAAELLFKTLLKAETPLLRSSLLSTWWDLSPRDEDLSPVAGDLVFQLLDDDRVDPAGSKKASPPTPRESAIYVLLTCNPQFDERLLAMLGDESALRRATAVTIFIARDAIDEQLTNRLFALANDNDERVRAEVALALAHVDHGQERAVRQLLEFLKQTPTIQRNAAESLAALAPEVSPARREAVAWALLDLYRENAAAPGNRAGMSLVSVMPSLAQEAQTRLVHDMLPLLEDDRPHRDWIWRTIAEAGPAGREALPHFRRRFETLDSKEQLRFARLLWMIEREPASVYPLFLAAVEHRSAVERYYGFNGLEAMGPSANAATPTMIKLLSHPKPIIVRQALDVLAAIGPTAADAIPHIKTLLASPDERLQQAAQTALAAIQHKTE